VSLKNKNAAEDKKSNLMTNIPQDFVFGRIENIVKGNSEFHNTKTWSQMSSGSRNMENNIRAQLLRKLVQFLHQCSDYKNQLFTHPWHFSSMLHDMKHKSHKHIDIYLCLQSLYLGREILHVDWIVYGVQQRSWWFLWMILPHLR